MLKYNLRHKIAKTKTSLIKYFELIVDYSEFLLAKKVYFIYMYSIYILKYKLVFLLQVNKTSHLNKKKTSY